MKPRRLADASGILFRPTEYESNAKYLGFSCNPVALRTSVAAAPTMTTTRAGSRTAFRLDTDSDATAIAELPDMRMGFKNGCQVFKRRQPTLFRP
jgi:hypothetical protein